MENNIFVLAFHNIKKHPKFEAIACWNHKPTFEDIMKLDCFQANTKLDRDLANLIAKNGKGGVKFSDELEDWCEYITIYPKDNGDLDLNDYLYTGYCDCNEKLLLDRRNYK